MKQKIGLVIVSAVVIVVVVLVAVSYSLGSLPQDDSRPLDEIKTVMADVVIPTKASRPGCEKTDNCYVPPKISINVKQTVSWLNDDSAFHSVTSGLYGSPTELFDSKYMDPGDVFSYTFDEPGRFEYHCTLHEWMQGVILVN